MRRNYAKRKGYSVLPVVLWMTLALIVCAGLINLLQGGKKPDEPERRQLESEEAVLNRADGLSGLLFSDKKVLMTEDGWFGLVRDDESGIWYAYVPAEMKGQLYAFFDSERSLDIEGEGVSESFESGDVLPAFAENEQYTFSLPRFRGQGGGERDGRFFIHGKCALHVY